MNSPSGAFVSVFWLLAIATAPARAETIIGMMPLSDLRYCGGLALSLSSSQALIDSTDREMAVQGRGIRSESNAIDAARRTIQIKDPKAVRSFNGRVAELGALVANYQSRIAIRNHQVSARNLTSADYNIKCVGRPYDPAMLSSLPPAEAAAFSKGATTMMVPQIARPDDDAHPSTPAPAPDTITIGGATPSQTSAGEPNWRFGGGSFPSFNAARAAADGGDAQAAFEIGMEYMNGGAVQRDEATAREWFAKAGEHSHAKALFALSILYGEGRGGDVNEAKAIDCLKRAAELGDADAEHNLALRYTRNEHNAADLRDAVKWMDRAATQGDPESQFVLSGFYGKGLGGRTDDALALTWLRRSALQGFGPAQSELGRRYEKGAGVEKDLVEGMKWYLLASHLKNDGPDRGCLRLVFDASSVESAAKSSVTRLGERMSPEDRDRANGLALHWRPSSSSKEVGGC